ncbi:SulP family inorganic anion transporter [Bacillus paranthracis]|uniref:SulP family inorganic anion transporter n=1 Tax=Bacillus paranthracis TaxID=2026186 RepID=A0A5M9GEB1_9BACI|nr:SulP family inorganic anion transporter [Bacillus paranthracis]QPA47657.1 SulP family inorganic anion transporter [Bacillus cereus]KAA8472055.1 SulP family inorganic anion transporter [Bacillus paranthracis]QPA41904.1 SulP family inorganic anion transporter [Bacillus paranthracis]QPA42119.1 SulP family inorganic anion transporter [Bacillus paranthracis]QPA42237.1 SulP family inorganic anion transporter [Bacillus paranthracis]
MVEKLKTEWFSNVRADILAGIVVALALIPEAIAFSIIAGVDPMVGLYASFCIAVIIAFVGGRPGMISGATGAMALLMVPLVKEHGLNYLLAATVLTGIIQVIFGVCKIAKVMKFIPRAVMTGFVNALAILIFMAQVPHFIGISNMTYIFVAITLVIVYVLPRFIKSIPAPLIAIIVLTSVAIFMHLDLRTVGDLGEIQKSLPTFFIPNVPFTFETLSIIFPYSLALAIVGLLESLLTSSIVDDMTGTESNKHKESRGQGIANIITGFFGGMAGCAMIGQSVINVKSGGRGRLSTLIAGLFLIFLIIVLGDLVVQIPMPVLVGIMIMVSIGTFDWSSFSYLVKAPKSDAAVMLVTVIIVVATHDLSKGVIAGVILSALFFVAKISKIQVTKRNDILNVVYDVKGPLFFASVEGFLEAFDFTSKNTNIVIDFSNTHIWDDSAVGAIDKVVLKFYENHNKVTIRGLNSSSKKLVEKLAVYNDPQAKISGH